MRNVLIAAAVLLIGVGSAYVFFRSSETLLPPEVVKALHEGGKERAKRIRWLAFRYSRDKDVWFRLVSTGDPAVTTAALEALARFRCNIPDLYFSFHEKGRTDYVTAIYRGLVYLAPWCDLRFVELAMADCASSDERVRKAAYAYMSFQTVEDWTADEMERSLRRYSLETRWLAWWERHRNRDRRSLIEEYTRLLLMRFCSDDPEVRKRAFEPLTALYGDDAYYLPYNDDPPSRAACDRWWRDNSARLLDAVMRRIEADRIYFKGL